MLAIAHAVALIGLRPEPVRVECSAAQGLPGTRVIGLPDTAIREATDRVSTAIKRSRLRFPDGRVVVNLAPADLHKRGSGFDLAIALGILAADGQLPPATLIGTWAVGELGLDGTARAVPGVLPIAAAVRDRGGRRLLVPEPAAPEAALIEGLMVVPVASLAEAVEVLRGEASSRPVAERPPVVTDAVPDLADVRGQAVARRAVELAAAGGHNLLLAGPPGCGKSMLAHRLPGLLPELSIDEALEVAAIHSVAGVRRPDDPLSCTPPFRAPHHTTSKAGLTGGGSGVPRPGEISLAHRGLLFVDELLEMPRHVLDALREPVEAGEVTIVRAQHVVRYPSDFLLVAATNPCPCGHLGSPVRACTCRPDRIERYRARLSGPLLDRIDLQVELRPVAPDALVAAPRGEPTATVAARVATARARAADRWGEGCLTRDVAADRIRPTCDPDALRALSHAVELLGLSARAFDRSLRVARTIADLAGLETVTGEHVDEAVAYRLPVVEQAIAARPARRVAVAAP